MLESARSVLTMTQGIDLARYAGDRMLRRAVEREIEIVGEASRHLSQALKDAHPEIPWRAVAAQRHRLAHEYDDVDDQVLWRVVTLHLPQLVIQLEQLVPQPPEGEL